MADLVVVPANVELISGPQETAVAGASITAGDVIYEDRADNYEHKPADADAGTPTTPVKGIALHDAEDGQPVTFAKPGAKVELGVATTVGELYLLSINAGGIRPRGDLASGQRTVLVGFGTSDAKLHVRLLDTGVNLA